MQGNVCVRIKSANRPPKKTVILLSDVEAKLYSIAVQERGYLSCFCRCVKITWCDVRYRTGYANEFNGAAGR